MRAQLTSAEPKEGKRAHHRPEKDLHVKEMAPGKLQARIGKKKGEQTPKCHRLARRPRIDLKNKRQQRGATERRQPPYAEVVEPPNGSLGNNPAANVSHRWWDRVACRARRGKHRGKPEEKDSRFHSSRNEIGAEQRKPAEHVLIRPGESLGRSRIPKGQGA
jgi:hypothetical protein